MLGVVLKICLNTHTLTRTHSLSITHIQWHT